MNLDAFRHKVIEATCYRSEFFEFFVCPYCVLYTRPDRDGRYEFCFGRIHEATNDTFGTSFGGDTPIGVLADYIEERDDGTPEFRELVSFLRGIA